MKILNNGQSTVDSWPGQYHGEVYAISNWHLNNYKFTLDGIGDLTGVDTLNRSSMTFNTPYTVLNYGTLHLQNGSSFVDQGTLTGTGAITANKSSVTIAGPSQTSETISLVNHSSLYLGVAPGIAFMAPIAMDATSTIHLTNQPANWGSILSSNEWTRMHPNAPADFIGDMAIVKSLTPGYRPEMAFQFGGPGMITGITIVDKPIVAAHA